MIKCLRKNLRFVCHNPNTMFKISKDQIKDNVGKTVLKTESCQYRTALKDTKLIIYYWYYNLYWIVEKQINYGKYKK